jgi:hypothetical protein
MWQDKAHHTLFRRGEIEIAPIESTFHKIREQQLDFVRKREARPCLAVLAVSAVWPAAELYDWSPASAPCLASLLQPAIGGRLARSSKLPQTLN